MQEIHSRLDQHHYEIETLKSGMGELIVELKESTKSTNELITQFAVSNQKHDENQKDIERLQIKSESHGELLAAMEPVVTGLRGVMWKLVSAIIVAIGSSSAIVAMIGK